MDLPNASSNVIASWVAIRLRAARPQPDAVQRADLRPRRRPLGRDAGGRGPRAPRAGGRRRDAQRRSWRGLLGRPADDLLDGAAALVVEGARWAEERGARAVGRPGPLRPPGRGSPAASGRCCRRTARARRLVHPGALRGAHAPTPAGAPVPPTVPRHDLTAAFGRASGALGVLQCAAAVGWLGTAGTTPGPDGRGADHQRRRHRGRRGRAAAARAGRAPFRGFLRFLRIQPWSAPDESRRSADVDEGPAGRHHHGAAASAVRGLQHLHLDRLQARQLPDRGGRAGPLRAAAGRPPAGCTRNTASGWTSSTWTPASCTPSTWTTSPRPRWCRPPPTTTRRSRFRVTLRVDRDGSVLKAVTAKVRVSLRADTCLPDPAEPPGEFGRFTVARLGARGAPRRAAAPAAALPDGDDRRRRTGGADARAATPTPGSGASPTPTATSPSASRCPAICG